MSRPNLIFFCELDSADLVSLLADGSVADDLAALGAGVALGIVDLSAQRAQVVRELNRRGIPLIAWQLLSEEDGHWYSLENAAAAVTRYTQFQDWTHEYGLEWQAMLFDFQPQYDALRGIRSGGLLGALPRLLARLGKRRRLAQACSVYQALAREMKRDGYATISMQLRFLADEQRAGSTLIQRLFGIVDVVADRRGLVVTSNSHRPLGPAMIYSYGRDAQLLLVGSATAAPGGAPPPLTWEELARDLLIAHHWTEEIAIHSLIGCVRQGFLKKLIEFDWAQEPPPRPADFGPFCRKRTALEVALWASRFLGWAGAGLLALLALARLLGAGQRES